TRKGVVIVNPGQMSRNALAPTVMLERMDVDGEPVALDKEIQLAPGKTRCTFSFAALSYRVNERVRFMYRLDNLDADWVDAGSRRSAEYAHLAPGTYRFRVIACNDDEVWNETGAEVVFTLAPFYHQSWTFRIGMAVVGILTIFLVYRARMRGVKARAAE